MAMGPFPGKVAIGVAKVNSVIGRYNHTDDGERGSQVGDRPMARLISVDQPAIKKNLSLLFGPDYEVLVCLVRPANGNVTSPPSYISRPNQEPAAGTPDELSSAFASSFFPEVRRSSPRKIIRIELIRRASQKFSGVLTYHASLKVYKKHVHRVKSLAVKEISQLDSV